MIVRDPSSKPWDINPKVWSSCLEQAKKEMLANGWPNERAPKFQVERVTKAHKIWNKLSWEEKHARTQRPRSPSTMAGPKPKQRHATR